MGESAIEWTEQTWNPTTGCDRISPGCDNCYALTLAARLKGMGQPRYQKDGDPRTSGPGFGLTLHEDALSIPLKRRKPTMWFVNSMSDLFHKDVDPLFIGRVFNVMARCPQHTFQILTKRPKRMSRVVTAYYEAVRDDLPKPYPNVWLGTSIESDDYVWRADHLRAAPASVRFISAEPLLGPLPSLDLTDIDWLIVGGESGPNHRPVDPQWVRGLRDACDPGGHWPPTTAFFFKQWGGRTPKSGGRTLDGRTWDEMPGVETEAVLF
jgi:protein gp37